MGLVFRILWSSRLYLLFALAIAGLSLPAAMGQSSAKSGKIASVAKAKGGSPAQTPKKCPLEVRLEADMPSYRVGDEITVEALIENTSGTALYLYADLGFGESASFSLFARDAVSGEDLPQSPIFDDLPPPPTSKDEFIELRPAHVYGVGLGCPLSQLGIKKKGTYDLLLSYHSPVPMSYAFGLPIFSREMGAIDAKPVRITVTD
jgi:hypothetical protein